MLERLLIPLLAAASLGAQDRCSPESIRQALSSHTTDRPTMGGYFWGHTPVAELDAPVTMVYLAVVHDPAKPGYGPIRKGEEVIDAVNTGRFSVIEVFEPDPQGHGGIKEKPTAMILNQEGEARVLIDGTTPVGYCVPMKPGENYRILNRIFNHRTDELIKEKGYTPGQRPQKRGLLA